MASNLTKQENAEMARILVARGSDVNAINKVCMKILSVRSYLLLSMSAKAP
jgi:hypothetical protein